MTCITVTRNLPNSISPEHWAGSARFQAIQISGYGTALEDNSQPTIPDSDICQRDYIISVYKRRPLCLNYRII